MFICDLCKNELHERTTMTCDWKIGVMGERFPKHLCIPCQYWLYKLIKKYSYEIKTK